MIKMPNNTLLKDVIDFKSAVLDIENTIEIAKNENKIIIEKDFENIKKTLILNENSTCTYITFDKSDKATLNIIDASLKKDAVLKIYNVVTSKSDAKISAKIDLNGTRSSVEIINLLLMNKNATLDSMVDIYHNTNHTSSNLTNYAISNANSKILLNNNATIKKASFASIAHQATKGLTLTKTSKIKALPNLYIDEYDVIANHACSIGSINKEDLFYLMSRGLSETEASKIVVMGYVKPILDHIDNDELKNEIEIEFAKNLIN